MICCNLDDSELPDNKKLSPFIEKSKVVEVNGRKIGLIGYVTTDTPVSTYSISSAYISKPPEFLFSRYLMKFLLLHTIYVNVKK